MSEISIFCKDTVDNLFDDSFDEVFQNVFPQVADSLDEYEWDILTLNTSYDISGGKFIFKESGEAISIITNFESLSKELVTEVSLELIQGGKDEKKIAIDLEKTKIVYSIDYEDEDTIGIKWIYFLSLASVICFKGNGFICIGETEWYTVTKVGNDFFLELILVVN